MRPTLSPRIRAKYPSLKEKSALHNLFSWEIGPVGLEAIPVVYSSERGVFVGYTTGGVRPCRTEGCLGVRIGVRWEEGWVTWPCTRRMVWEIGKGWRIVGKPEVRNPRRD